MGKEPGLPAGESQRHLCDGSKRATRLTPHQQWLNLREFPRALTTASKRNRSAERRNAWDVAVPQGAGTRVGGEGLGHSFVFGPLLFVPEPTGPQKDPLGRKCWGILVMPSVPVSGLESSRHLASRGYLSRRYLRKKSSFMDFTTFLLTGDIYSPKLVQSEFQTSVYDLREQNNYHHLFT